MRKGLINIAVVALATFLASCGSESPTQPTPSPTPAPTPTPTPAPTPVPTPTPGGKPENQVVRFDIKVEYVICNGKILPGSEFQTTVKVGCTVRVDGTAKDSRNKATTPVGEPDWTFKPTNLTRVNRQDPFGPIFEVLRTGTMQLQAEVDGVKSNILTFTFVS